MPSAPDDPHPLIEPPESAAVSAFLRALAARAERDSAFARQIAELLVQSGLLAAEPALSVDQTRHGSAARPGRRAKASAVIGAATDLDVFAVLRESGMPGLATHLDALDIVHLRQVIRRHRLDPARVSARWTNRARLIALITDQVRAQADHGRAFAKV